MKFLNRALAAGFILALLGSAWTPGAAVCAEEHAIAADKAAVERVQRGEVSQAKASWWGFDPDDSTAQLQAALDSKARRVVIDDLGSPWIVTPITIPGNKEVVFEPGVIVEAKRGEFLGKGDCLFTVRDQENVVLRGEGAVLRMHKADYHQPPYEKAEWRHALSIRGCRNVTVEGLVLRESGGDGIYLGTGSGRTPNRDITIRNVICDGNNRQGVSVITVAGLLMENCVFKNTEGTAPQAGIDFEPNRPDELLVDCTLRNCRSENNAGHAYLFYFGNLHAESEPVSIRLENCTSQGCRGYSSYLGIANREGKHSVRGTIDFVNCQLEDDADGGVYVRGNEADGCRIRFAECTVIRSETVIETERAGAAFTLAAASQPDWDIGNVVFEGCTVNDATNRRPIALSASPLARLRNITGAIAYTSPNGTQRLEIDDRQLAEWFPEQSQAGRIPRYDFQWQQLPAVEAGATDLGARGYRLRRRASLLLWCRAGVPLELVARLQGVGGAIPQPGTFHVTAPDGQTTELEPRPDGDQLAIRFTPREDGVHRLQWSATSSETLRVQQSSVPLAFLAEKSGLDLFVPSGTLHFWVPAGVERFALVVAGSGTKETVRATVRDGHGNVVQEKDNIAAPQMFFLQRSPTDPEETWSITLKRASEGVLEDVSLHAVGIPPVFALTPEGLPIR